MLNPHYQQIWQTVQLIPIGKVACYGQIADLAGLPGRARLVGKALGKVPEGGWKNKAVPWFRVINSQGKISFHLGASTLISKNSCFKKSKLSSLVRALSCATFNGSQTCLKYCFHSNFELGSLGRIIGYF